MNFIENEVILWINEYATVKRGVKGQFSEFSFNISKTLCF